MAASFDRLRMRISLLSIDTYLILSLSKDVLAGSRAVKKAAATYS